MNANLREGSPYRAAARRQCFPLRAVMQESRASSALLLPTLQLAEGYPTA